MDARTHRRLNRAALAAFVLTLFFVVSGRTAAAQSNTPSVAASHPGLPYAVADFDGDQRPDVAAIEGGNSSASVADYSIRLNLSGSGSLSIPLIAPAGGLSVEARDVNGDHAPDLIVATTWQHQPVAVFLNNGHGGFSRVETSNYESSFEETDGPSASAPSQQIDAFAMLAPESAGFCTLIRAVCDYHEHACGFAKSTTVGFSYGSLPPHSGRAPPLSVTSL